MFFQGHEMPEVLSGKVSLFPDIRPPSRAAFISQTWEWCRAVEDVGIWQCFGDGDILPEKAIMVDLYLTSI